MTLEYTISSALNVHNSMVNTDNQTEEDHPIDVMEIGWVKAIFIIIYCIIFILGISGNLLVVYVVLRHKTMRSITNIFIANLAVSDMVMCLLAVPLTPLSSFLGSWVFGEALCHILPMIIAVSVYVSTLTSMVIAIYRYVLVVTPCPPALGTPKCAAIIFSIWIVSSFISMPLAIYQQLTWVEMEASYICYEYWPSRNARRTFTFVSFILQYVFPCLIISFCYIKVTAILRCPAPRLERRCSTRPSEDEREVQHIASTNRMLIAVIVIFVVCWLPLNALHIIVEYTPHWDQTALVFFLTHVLAMCSTIYNPFLYAWMNEQFRHEFRQIVPFLFPKQIHTTNCGLVTAENTHDLDTRAHNAENKF